LALGMGCSTDCLLPLDRLSGVGLLDVLKGRTFALTLTFRATLGEAGDLDTEGVAVGIREGALVTGILSSLAANCRRCVIPGILAFFAEAGDGTALAIVAIEVLPIGVGDSVISVLGVVALDELAEDTGIEDDLAGTEVTRLALFVSAGLPTPHAGLGGGVFFRVLGAIASLLALAGDGDFVVGLLFMTVLRD